MISGAIDWHLSKPKPDLGRLKEIGCFEDAVSGRYDEEMACAYLALKFPDQVKYRLDLPYFAPEAQRQRYQELELAYLSGNKDIDFAFIVDFECSRLSESILSGRVPNFPFNPELYLKRSEVNLDIPSGVNPVEYLLASVPVLRTLDPTMFLLDRLARKTKELIRGNSALPYKRLFDLLQQDLLNVPKLVFDGKEPSLHSYMHCSLSALHEWRPDPPECMDLPISSSAKSANQALLLLNLMPSMQSFIEEYKKDFADRLLHFRTDFSREETLLHRLQGVIDDASLLQGIHVMLSDWREAEKTGVLLRSTAYWPEIPVANNTNQFLEEQRRRVEAQHPEYQLDWRRDLEMVQIELKDGALLTLSLGALALLQRLKTPDTSSTGPEFDELCALGLIKM